MKNTWLRLKKKAALLLALLMMIGNAGYLPVHAAGRESSLTWDGGDLSFNLSAAIAGGPDESDWFLNVTKAAGLSYDSLTDFTALNNALSGYEVCDVLVRDGETVYIAAYRENETKSSSEEDAYDVIIVGLNRGSAVEVSVRALYENEDIPSSRIEHVSSQVLMAALPETEQPAPVVEDLQSSTTTTASAVGDTVTTGGSMHTTSEAVGPGNTETGGPDDNGSNGVGSDNNNSGSSDTGVGSDSNDNGSSDTGVGSDSNDNGSSDGGVGSDSNDNGSSDGGVGSDSNDNGSSDTGVGSDSNDNGSSDGGVGSGGNDSGFNDTGVGSDSNDNGSSDGGVGSDSKGNGSSDTGVSSDSNDSSDGAEKGGESTNLGLSQRFRALVGDLTTDVPTNTVRSKVGLFSLGENEMSSIAFTAAVDAYTPKEIEIAKEKVDLFGEGQPPQTGQPLEIPDQGIDPQQVFGLKYTCQLNADLSLADIAGRSITLDLESLAKVFDLSDSGASYTLSIRPGGFEDSVVIGKAVLDTVKKEVTFDFLDADTLQQNVSAVKAEAKISEITDISASFWMSFHFDKSVKHDTTQTHIVLGNEGIKLDWSNIDNDSFDCSISKKAGDYDGNAQMLSWTVTLEPQKSASLDGALFTDTLGEHLTFDPAVEGAFVIKQDNKSVSITNGGQTTPIQVSGSSISFEIPASLKDDGIDLTKAITIAIKTAVDDELFRSSMGKTKAIVSNSASIEKDGGSGFPRRTAEADKTFEAGWFSKAGDYKLTGAHAREIGWTIKISAPVRLHNAKVYDLLAPELGVIDVTSGSGWSLSGASWNGSDLTTDPSSPSGNWYEVVSVTKGSVSLPDFNDYPQGVKDEISSLSDGDERYLAIFHLKEVPAGDQKIEFYTPLSLNGAGGDHKTTNTAYITVEDMGSGGPGQGGPGGPGGEIGGKDVTVQVTYSQAAIEKKGSYDRKNHHLTWQIDANNNKSVLTGGVTITDDLTSVLTKSGWEAEFDPATAGALTWWSDSSPTAQAVERAAQAPAAPDAFAAEPQYTYDDKGSKKVLKIYVKEMNGETYHFKIDTEITGKKVYECSYEANNIKGTVKESNSTDFTNKATLSYNGREVSDSAQVKAVSKFLAKEAYSSGAGGVGVPYDPADNTFWWKLQINADGRYMSGNADGTGGPVVIDELPDGFSYLGYELYQGGPATSNSHYMTLGGRLETSDAPENPAYLSVVDSGKQVSFTFREPIDSGRILYVKTKIDPTRLSEDKTFENRCSLSFNENGRPVETEAGVQTKISIAGVSKVGKQTFVNGKAVYEVDWTMDVNRDGLANGFDAPEITDVLPEGCTLQTTGDSFNVEIYKLKVSAKNKNNDKVRTIVAGDAVIVSGDLAAELKDHWNYDPSTRTFTFRLPEETNAPKQYSAYRVILHADIDASKAGTTMANTVNYAGIRAEETVTSENVKIYFFGADAGAQWNPSPVGKDNKELTIYKVSSVKDASGAAITLEGAQFNLVFELGGKEIVWKVSTGSDGTAFVRGIPADAQNIRLEEIKAPDGYQLPADPVTPVVYGNGILSVTITIENTPKPVPGPDPSRPDHGRDPKPDEPTDEPTVDLPDEEIPAGEIPGGNSGEIPAVGDDPADGSILIPDEELPAGSIPTGQLPKTGGLDAALFYGAGVAMAGLGILLRRKQK